MSTRDHGPMGVPAAVLCKIFPRPGARLPLRTAPYIAAACRAHRAPVCVYGGLERARTGSRRDAPDALPAVAARPRVQVVRRRADAVGAGSGSTRTNSSTATSTDAPADDRRAGHVHARRRGLHRRRAPRRARSRRRAGSSRSWPSERARHLLRRRRVRARHNPTIVQRDRGRRVTRSGCTATATRRSPSPIPTRSGARSATARTVHGTPRRPTGGRLPRADVLARPVERVGHRRAARARLPVLVERAPRAQPALRLSGPAATPHRWPSGLLELPCPVADVGPITNPYLGGIYFRVLPWTAVRYGLSHADPDEVLWAYCHPYDFDPGEPFQKRPDLGPVEVAAPVDQPPPHVRPGEPAARARRRTAAVRTRGVARNLSRRPFVVRAVYCVR